MVLAKPHLLNYYVDSILHYKLFFKENIVFDKASKVPNEEINKALEKVGLLERIEELDKGLDTSLYKNFDKNEIELSGGQAQKLAIARV